MQYFDLAAAPLLDDATVQFCIIAITGSSSIRGSKSKNNFPAKIIPATSARGSTGLKLDRSLLITPSRGARLANVFREDALGNGENFGNLSHVCCLPLLLTQGFI